MSDYQEFIKNLYRIVDNKDAEALVALLHDEVKFTFGNADTVTGKEAVKTGNIQFFETITSMSHSFDGIYKQDNTLICDGTVNYVRLDGSHFEAKFATILTLKNGLIYDYKIFADISGL